MKANLLSRLRVVSANLWRGRAHPASFADLIRGLEPDVVAVQELTPPQAEALAQVMPHGVLEPEMGYRGMGMALRRPGRVRRLALPGRDARIAEIHVGDGATPDGVLEIINLHVQAPHSLPLWRAWRERSGQLRGIERYLDASGQRRRVLVGDFNATPLWPTYRRLAVRMQDAALEVARRKAGRARPTWGPWPGAPRVLRIDHALVTGVTVADFQVVPVAGADHSAIVVDLVVTADPVT